MNKRVAVHVMRFNLIHEGPTKGLRVLYSIVPTSFLGQTKFLVLLPGQFLPSENTQTDK